MRVLVCGGRYYSNKDKLFEVLNGLKRKHGTLTIINGGSTGADFLARLWWRVNHTGELFTMKADWKREGRRAGSLRNQRMLDTYNPELVVAFPGGSGTRDMVSRARAACVEVLEIKDSSV